MVKLTKEQELELKLKQQLNNFNPSEVESYLEVLLRKCLEAAIKKDYLALGSVEDILNKSIVILASKVKNFNLMYSNLKLKVATDYLAKYVELDNTEAFKFFNVLPEFTTLEEANLIAATKEYEKYKYGLIYYNDIYEEIVENEAYSCIIEPDELLHINFKGYNELDSSEIGVGEGCYDWADEIAVLKAFVNNSVQEVEKEPSEALKYLSIKKKLATVERYEGHFQRWEEWNRTHELKRRIDKETGSTILYTEGGEFNDPIYKPPIDCNRIYYNKENENFIAIIDYYHLVIIDKRNKNRIVIYNGYNEFLYKFCDYCLGLEPKELEVPEESSEVDPTEEAAENISSENAVPINEG